MLDYHLKAVGIGAIYIVVVGVIVLLCVSFPKAFSIIVTIVVFVALSWFIGHLYMEEQKRKRRKKKDEKI